MADDARAPVNQAPLIPQPRPDSPHGKAFHPQNDAELAQVIDRAFDYRGDVTLGLDDGTSIEGYLSNRDHAGRMIEFLPRGRDLARLHYARIRSISFSGQDTADGKSWENWIAKKTDQRHAEAERIRQEAIARGEL